MFKWVELMAKVYPYVPEIRAREAAEFAKRGEITLIDVRADHEIRRFGQCRGAIHIPMHMMRHAANPNSPHHHAALDPSKSYAIYCESGNDALAAARMLLKMGYTEIYNMGAFREWFNCKLPVDTPGMAPHERARIEGGLEPY